MKQTTVPLYLQVKPYQDVLLSVVILIVLSPLFLLISVLILLDDPGASPIFSQQRVGEQGRIFTMYKFRSMYSDADLFREGLQMLNEMDGPVFKIKNDPRITRFGSFLRKTGLDELPQFWNVLRGEMSIVGPRPALPEEVQRYEEKAKQRLSVRPGITCYWQVQPQRNRLSFDEWLRLDLQYLRERSFLVDWSIMFSTLKTVITMSGE